MVEKLLGCRGGVIKIDKGDKTITQEQPRIGLFNLIFSYKPSKGTGMAFSGFLKEYMNETYDIHVIGEQ